MIVLCDTSAMQVDITLVDGESRHDYTWQADRTLARDLLAYLRDRLAEHATQLHELSGIGVYRGPGSYTGLRIGLTVLNTLASSEAIPIVGATGSNWQHDCLVRLAAHQNDTIVLPEYGSDARTTTPRK